VEAGATRVYEDIVKIFEVVVPIVVVNAGDVSEKRGVVVTRKIGVRDCDLMMRITIFQGRYGSIDGVF